MISGIGHLWLEIRASGLQQDAVIEIMLALLGAMVAVLTLVAGLFAAVVAIVGVFGYQSIRDEATRKAESVAEKIASNVAEKTATAIARKGLDQMREEVQASGLSEGQAEPATHSAPTIKASVQVVRGTARNRRKATTDKNLQGGRSGDA